MERSNLNKLLEFSFINLDKPSGPTSFTVSQFIKNSLNLKKTAHLGTLDPQVSGILPIALNRACKLNEYLMHKDKTYVGIMRTHIDIPLEKLKRKIKKFTGKITQLPPVRSRVKRAPRERTIHSFNILEKSGKDFLFETKVQAGTYIRKLIHDVGEEIGGAHMLELRRTQAGIFKEPAITLYDFEKNPENYLIPAESIIKKVLPKAQAKPDSIKSLLQGKPIHKADIINIPKEENFALFNKETFIGIYRKTEHPQILAKPEFVYN
jgi:H/ACA ribonucleoprotein complex subunit 4